MVPTSHLRTPSRVARTLARVLCVCGCLVAGGARATAQAQASAKPDTTKGKVTVLAPVTVTGKRELAVAPPVSTIEVSPAVVQRAPASNPYDMIGRAAGIEVHQQGQGPGFASDVVIGGFTSDHSSDVLLVLDGVPINLPIHGHVEGYADWSILSPGAISVTRVIHGPASPLYGDFSIGGVIEAYTEADASGPSGSFGVTSYRRCARLGRQRVPAPERWRARLARAPARAGVARQRRLFPRHRRPSRVARRRHGAARGRPLCVRLSVELAGIRLGE